MGLFGKKKSNQTNINENEHEALLDKILYKVPGTETAITWADAVEGTLITGSTGSGKSSGPGRHIALSMLKSGFGMCILCAKPDEADRWKKYVEEKAPERSADLVFFNKNSRLKFNFLEYEITRGGQGAGEAINMINALMSLNEQNKIYQSGGAGKDERFWDNSLRRIISRTISLLRLADEKVSIDNMRKIVAGHLKDNEPKVYQHLKEKSSTQEKIDPNERKEALEELALWLKSSYFLSVINKLEKKRFTTAFEEDESQITLDYWMKEFPRLSERPASIISESFMGLVEIFINRGILKEQFSEGVSDDLRPENIITKNKIVVVDFPIKEFGLAGIYAATIYKTTFQAAMERRKIEEEDSPKPCGLWIDEYHSFCSPMTDSIFQSTARSSWVASVYITQSIQNLYFVMGDKMPVARAKSLLGNLNLKYFASNSDAENNEWASNMIGKHFTYVESVHIDRDKEVSKNKSQQMQFRLTPDHFTTLKTGRKSNKFIVEAVAFKAGKSWGKDKKNYAIVKFDQRN